jgi:riboflavin kinase/FMN adenylyltransferase
VTLIWDLQHFPEQARGGAVSVGNFDGVHLGHAALVSQLTSLARDISGPSVVITFDPHPAALLRPGSEPIALTEIPRRAQLLADLGVDFVAVCQTNQKLLDLSPRDFFEQVLVGQIGMRGIVEGPNFFFGKSRGGDTHTLARYCQPLAIPFHIVDATSTEGGMVSSTEVRRRIAAGDLAQANLLLTAPYQLSGVVTHGDGRGKSLGFPTANLEQIHTLIPAHGVYATRVTVAGKRYAAATHIGPNPTFDPLGPPKVETHIIDFNGDLYDRPLAIEFVDGIRTITRFSSVDELIAQLHFDIDAARRLTGYSL